MFCRTLQKILFIDMAIIAFMTMGWIFGITASHFQKDSLVILFLVSHFLLALIVFGLRCLMDDQVSHLLFEVFSIDVYGKLLHVEFGR